MPHSEAETSDRNIVQLAGTYAQRSGQALRSGTRQNRPGHGAPLWAGPTGCSEAVAAVSLEHNDPNCAGLWRHELEPDQLHWRCERCRAIALHSDAVARAAIQENLWGTTLRVLHGAREWLTMEDEEEWGR